MAQFEMPDFESPASGDSIINGGVEPAFAAVYTSHSGSSRPSYVQPGMVWLNTDTNPWVLNLYKGSSTDIPLGTLDTTLNQFTASAAASAIFTSVEGEVSGTNDIVIDETVPSNFVLEYGATLVFVAPASNTGDVTINVKGTGAIDAVKVDPVTGGFGQLQIGDMIPGNVYYGFYDGTNWQIINVIFKPVPQEHVSSFSVSFAQFEAPVIATAAITITLPSTAFVADYFTFRVFARDGAVTLNPDTADAINGRAANANFVIPKGATADVFTDAAGKWYVLGVATEVGASALSDGATINWDASGIPSAKVTLGGNRTLANPTNMKDGGTYVLRVTQDGTGSRTLAYGSAYKWPGGTAPVLSTGANDVDILSFTSDGTNMFGVIQKDFS